MRKKHSFILILLVVLLPVFITAQVSKPQPSISISGDIPKAIQYTVADLNQIKRVSVNVKDMAKKEHSYSGIAITDIFKMAGIIKPEFHHDNLTRYVLVQAPDNYEVLFSMSELDSAFSGRTIILADQMDGKALPEDKGPFRIIVPWEEKKEARWIWSVSNFIIRNSKN